MKREQVPGSTTYSLALYYMMEIPLENVPLLEGFVKGDDAYRNSRFKLIPYISKVSFRSFGRISPSRDGQIKVSAYLFWKLSTGIVDCEAERGQEGVLGRASS